MNDLGPADSRAETPTFSNLISTMNDEDLFAQLERPCGISRSARPKIQRVAHHLRNRKAFAEYYSPRMLSLGPIHHGEPHLKLGEKYKIMWASMYIQRDQEMAQRLHRQIAEDIQELKNLYDEDAIRQFNDQQLARMLFLDGCALLQILKNPDILDPAPLNAKVDQLALVRQDALLLENQLPFRVLQLLSDGTDDNVLFRYMDKFLDCHHLSTEIPGQHVIDTVPAPTSSNRSPPAHLLDELRINVLAGFRPPENPTIPSGKIKHRNLKELRASGIQAKKSHSSKCPIHITFSSCCLSGELKLPELVVDDTSASTYLNLMAYEACPDFENKYEISSYVEFLDSLIDHPDDVKELRDAEVLHNGLGSDEEVAKLFNIIGTDVVPNDAIYASLRADIESHYKNKYKTWYELAKTTYFSNPWSIIALIAGFFILFLTSVQAWFAAFSSPH